MDKAASLNTAVISLYRAAALLGDPFCSYFVLAAYHQEGEILLNLSPAEPRMYPDR